MKLEQIQKSREEIVFSLQQLAMVSVELNFNS